MSRWTDQMYDHKVDVVRGPAPMHRLEYVAPPATGETWNRGAVVSADANGNLVAGCAAGTVGVRPMPMTAIQGSQDLDVDPEQNGTGFASALVATGGYEIATTEFVAADEDSIPIEYAVNTLLTANSAGQYTKAAADAYGSTVPIVGVCSVANSGVGSLNAAGGRTASNYNVRLLTLWPVYLPCAGA